MSDENGMNDQSDTELQSTVESRLRKRLVEAALARLSRMKKNTPGREPLILALDAALGTRADFEPLSRLVTDPS